MSIPGIAALVATFVAMFVGGFFSGRRRSHHLIARAKHSDWPAPRPRLQPRPLPLDLGPALRRHGERIICTPTACDPRCNLGQHADHE